MKALAILPEEKTFQVTNIPPYQSLFLSLDLAHFNFWAAVERERKGGRMGHDLWHIRDMNQARVRKGERERRDPFFLCINAEVKAKSAFILQN